MFVIGLGNGGVRIAEEFQTYPQYEVYKIGLDLEEGPKTFPIVFHDGKFVGGFNETAEYIKCNLMKFDVDF